MFYVEARQKDGSHYSRNSMKNIRAGLDRYLSSLNVEFSIVGDRLFKPANDVLDASLKTLARHGLISSTKHKPPICPDDIEILYEANQLGTETPQSLVQTAWFYVLLYFGKRGRENQRSMVADDIVLNKSSNDSEFITLRERATKNHLGGLNDNEDESLAVMAEWPNNPRCPVLCLKKYLTKRDPRCTALWQKPRDHFAGKFSYSDEIWFCNSPIGKNKLENLLSIMSKNAGLSTIYTPHCIRATSVTLLKAAGLDNQRVKSVTGHKSDKSIESYSSRPTFRQQVESSKIVSNFLTNKNNDIGVPALPAPVPSQDLCEVLKENLPCPPSVPLQQNCLQQDNSLRNMPVALPSGNFYNCTFNFNHTLNNQ